jgi:hypothetical protein
MEAACILVMMYPFPNPPPLEAVLHYIVNRGSTAEPLELRIFSKFGNRR